MSEQKCPCCGRGMVSGVPTPSCADTIPEGWEMAHAMWCNDYADDVCNKCASQMLKEAS